MSRPSRFSGPGPVPLSTRSGTRWRRRSSRIGLTGGLLSSAIVLAACTGANGQPRSDGSRTGVAQVAAPVASTVLPSGDATSLSIRACEAVWVASPVAITVDRDAASIARATQLAVSLALPVLVLPAEESAGPADSPAPESPSATTDPIAAELGRLGSTHVLHVGSGDPKLPGVEVLSSADDLPDFDAATPLSGVAGMTVSGRSTKGTTAALATLEAAGAVPLELAAADPRANPDDVEATAQVNPDAAIGVGSRFGDPDVFAQRVATAATGVQLPGGGQTIFDGKRYVALYGHPLTGSLGALGEQDPQRAVARVQQVAAQYEELADETIVPAFEMIATVAAGGAGEDGDYSREWDVDVLRPLVDSAGEAGLYVVLDLQSGRSDFLSQAKLYEELLLEPHVGLALDPEWRLKKGELPLRQIGSVGAAEINRTMDWLADLTAEYDLPQKMVLLHQFRADMITNRADLDLDHDELAVIVQMDGDGTLGQKLDTWGALRVGAPDNLRFGWKNFYDEDEPTPSPATTFSVRPKPWWVSYQ